MKNDLESLFKEFGIDTFDDIKKELIKLRDLEKAFFKLYMQQNKVKMYPYTVGEVTLKFKETKFKGEYDSGATYESLQAQDRAINKVLIALDNKHGFGFDF